ncbi:phosphate ABC transporter ATP-binding protein [Shewanella surugensis]|uniref:Phosphate ABC transporter ATP-binding protein n=1 Tax=Shewanella surugensis TaxID=212020 RepID=A0ABT0L8T0_9GAMM|nr:phosphate ABC transporter ATP-binding protein [Shewanella surugensis]MCL1123954.1 phosphate ABC transporter ATP-binding protein [Shewanella surugensis]
MGFLYRVTKHDEPLYCQAQAARVDINQLSIKYKNKQAINNASLVAQPGQITALIGPSGCGKSSILSSINRIHQLVPDCCVEGEIKLDGVNINEIPDRLLRQRIGMVFQQPNPFPLSVEENIRFPLRQYGISNKQALKERVEKVLREVNLWEEVKQDLKASAFLLSGGQQQRLCIARSLALEPDILLLDEPCSALDPISTAKIESLLLGLKDKITIIIVTHNLAQAKRIADQISVCWVNDKGGCIVESGGIDKIFNHPTHPTTHFFCNGLQG